MRIGIDMGHSLSGAGTGAVGIVKETDNNRAVGKRLIELLKEKGHTVVNCTVDSASTAKGQLQAIVAKERGQNLDLFVSLHLNAFDGTAHGTETYIYNGNYAGKNELRAIARRINDKVAGSCGFYNRGQKEADFHVLRETSCPACLVEMCFCDSRRDIDKWNTEKIAVALFEGITGTTYTYPAPPSKPSTGGTTFYRVVAGSYTDRKNADAMVAKLKGLGISSFIDVYKK